MSDAAELVCPDSCRSGPLPGYVLRRQPGAQPAAADGRRRAAPVGARPGDDGQRRGLAACERVCIVGTPALRDFHPSLCAANLARAGHRRSRGEPGPEARARRHEHAGDGAPLRRRALAAAVLRRAVADAARRGARGAAGDAGSARSPRGARRRRAPARPPRVRDPDAAAVGARDAAVRDPALGAARRRRPAGARRRGDRRASATGDRVASVATHAAGRDLSYVAPWFVLASGGFASGGIELDSHWVTHERVLGLPLRGVPADGEPRFVGHLPRRAADGARRRGRRRRPARRGRRERARGRRRATRGDAVARGLGRGDRAGQRLPRGAGGRSTA